MANGNGNGRGIDWSRLNVWAALVLIAMVAGAVIVLLRTPPEVLVKLPWDVIVGGIVVFLGGGSASLLGRLVRRNPETLRRSDPDRTPTDPGRDRNAN